jgi:hypothetical protein
LPGVRAGGPAGATEAHRRILPVSQRVSRELWGLVRFIDSARLCRAELQVAGAVLAATVREVSFSRNGQWKLHRLPSGLRRRGYRPPWAVFQRRLRRVVLELRTSEKVNGHLDVFIGDAREVSNALEVHRSVRQFDVVMTSPPYGDSRTTVHYGGMSSLCLSVLCHVRRLRMRALPSSAIDRRCFGVVTGLRQMGRSARRLLRKAPPIGEGARRMRDAGVTRFVVDLERSVREMTRVLKPGGRLVVIIGRRRTGGWRLYLDRLIIDVCRNARVRLEVESTRRIVAKRTPARVDVLRRQRGAHE